MIYLEDNPFGWYSPDISKLPGGGTFEDLTRGLGGFVVVALLLGLLLAAGSWALGVGTGNIQWAERGKQGTVAAFLIALLVGAAGTLLGFFFGTGQGLHGPR
jgi:hypothetical protein